MEKRKESLTSGERSQAIFNKVARPVLEGKAIGAMYDPELTPEDPQEILVFQEPVDKDGILAHIDTYATVLKRASVSPKDVRRIKEDILDQFHNGTAEQQSAMHQRLTNFIKSLF